MRSRSLSAPTSAGPAGPPAPAAFTLSGSGWWTGFELVRVLYAGSIAKTRPYEYLRWANLAALLLVLGPAVLAGLRRILRQPTALPLSALLLAVAAPHGDPVRRRGR